MIIDKETDIFLKNRIKNNSKLHHLLDPVQLRTERLRQLREDNLTEGPGAAVKIAAIDPGAPNLYDK